jgi:hypothetical protein
MPPASDPIRENEVGPFGELSARPNPDGLVVLQVPPFEQMLLHLEQREGLKLTPEEVEQHRRQAPSIVVSRDVAEKMAEARASRG